MLSEIRTPPSLVLRGRKVEDLPAERGSKWWVGCIKSRMEFRFAHELWMKDMSYFLPMEEYDSTDAGREVVRHRLMFPGYIFILANREDFHQMNRERRMWTKFRPGKGGQKFLREDLQRVLCFGDALTYVSTVEDFQPGDEVKIVAPHTLAGEKAYAVDGIKSGRIALRCSLIPGAAEFLIDPKFLQPV